MLTPFLLLVTSASSAGAQLPSQHQSICFREMGYYDSIAIVQPTSVSDVELRNGDSPRFKHAIQVLEVSIVDANWNPPGTRTSFVVPLRYRELPFLLPDPTKRYLIVGAKARAGRLEIVDGSWISAGVARWIDAANDSERIAFLMYRTEATRLPITGTPADRLALALADCFVPAQGATLRELCELHRQSYFPGARYDQIPPPPYIEPTPLTRRIAEIAMTKPLVERALVQRVLVAWRVLGSTVPLMKTLYACLPDANAFVNPEEYIDIPDFSARSSLPPGYTPERLAPDTCVDQLLTARNLKVRKILMRKSIPPPSIEQQRRMAVFLDDDDIEVRYLVVNMFAGWHLNRDRMVTSAWDRELKETIYPGLDEIVAWWKQYWREH